MGLQFAQIRIRSPVSTLLTRAVRFVGWTVRELTLGTLGRSVISKTARTKLNRCLAASMAFARAEKIVGRILFMRILSAFTTL